MGKQSVLSGIASAFVLTGVSSVPISFANLLVGDNPLISSLDVNANLSSDFETITVSNVTSTGEVESVFVLVTRPDGQLIVEPLILTGSSYVVRSYALCSGAGDYEIAVYAADDDGGTSLPALATSNRSTPCTDFMFQSSFE